MKYLKNFDLKNIKRNLKRERDIKYTVVDICKITSLILKKDELDFYKDFLNYQDHKNRISLDNLTYSLLENDALKSFVWTFENFCDNSCDNLPEFFLNQACHSNSKKIIKFLIDNHFENLSNNKSFICSDFEAFYDISFDTCALLFRLPYIKSEIKSKNPKIYNLFKTHTNLKTFN